LAIPGAGKTFGPYSFAGSDADGTDTTYGNDTWTFSNLSSRRDGPSTSGEDMDYAPWSTDQLTVRLNGVVQVDGSDYTFTAGSNGDAFAGTVVFEFKITDADSVQFDLRDAQ